MWKSTRGEVLETSVFAEHQQFQKKNPKGQKLVVLRKQFVMAHVKKAAIYVARTAPAIHIDTSRLQGEFLEDDKMNK